MSDQDLVFALEPNSSDAIGIRGLVKPDDAEWLKERVRREPGSTRVQLTPDPSDTEGHEAADLLTVRVIAMTDDDDTEGHAISVHFPTRDEADAFRKRLILTGVLAGSVALGAAGGYGLSALQSTDTGGGGAGAVATQTNPDAAALAGAADMAAPFTIQDAQDAAALAGAASAIEAPAGVQDAQDAAALSAAAGAMERPLGASGTQAGPMDAHEAPAFAAAAAAGTAATDADRDVGIMDGSNAAAATQAGPMDAHEAPAFAAGAAAESTVPSGYVPENPGGTRADQSTVPSGYVPENPGGTVVNQSTVPSGYVAENPGGTVAAGAAASEAGPMDAHEAPAFGGGSGGDENEPPEPVVGPR